MNSFLNILNKTTTSHWRENSRLQTVERVKVDTHTLILYINRSNIHRMPGSHGNSIEIGQSEQVWHFTLNTYETTLLFK